MKKFLHWFKSLFFGKTVKYDFATLERLEPKGFDLLIGMEILIFPPIAFVTSLGLERGILIDIQRENMIGYQKSFLIKYLSSTGAIETFYVHTIYIAGHIAAEYYFKADKI